MQPAQGQGQLVLGRNRDSHSRAQCLRALMTQTSPHFKEMTHQPRTWLTCCCGELSAEGFPRAELGAQIHPHSMGQTARHGCGQATSRGQCWPLASPVRVRGSNWWGKKIKATKGENGLRLNVSEGKSGTFSMVQV